MTPPIAAVVFDLGGVLIDWDPRYLYRSLFEGDETAMEKFLAEVCTPAWNHQQDAGRPWGEAVETLARDFPDQRALIEAFHVRWEEMLGGPIDETVEILAELRETGRVRLFALSNWSAETFPIARRHYPFLGWFEGIVISGEVGICKPDAAVFEHLFRVHGLDPRSTVFVDDSDANIDAARNLGIIALRFGSPKALRGELATLGLLRAAVARSDSATSYARGRAEKAAPGPSAGPGPSRGPGLSNAVEGRTPTIKRRRQERAPG